MLYSLLKNKEKKERSVRAKPCLGRRINLGLYETLVLELRFEDESEYKKILRITPQDFDEIFGLIQDDITKITFINYRVGIMRVFL